MTSYPTAAFTRPGLAPGILGAIILMAGLALLDNPDGFFWIRFPVSVLALILCIFAWQGRQWWWIAPLVAIAVAWNPAWVIPLSGQGWVAGQFVAALVFIASGILVKVPSAEDRARRG